MNFKPLLLLLLRATNNIYFSLAQDCSMAPTPDLVIFCEQLQRWDSDTRDQLRLEPFVMQQVMPPGFPSEPQGSWQPNMNTNQVQLPSSINQGQLPIPRSPYSCMELSCLCQFINGRISPDGACFLNNGRRLTQAVRKEYRRLTDDERNRFHSAMNQLKQNGEYNNFARVHAQMSDAGGAHSGPAFLPWHREFTKRLEIALRMIDPDLAMPYWDSVLDQYLPDARDSVLWSSEFFGESDSVGNVISGPFANWRTLEGRNSIQRHLGRQASLMKEDELNVFYQKNNIASVLAHTSPRASCPFTRDFTALEYVHGNVHFWVGGDMLDQSKSANDPTFFLHHSFVDLIWEQWRQSRQSRWERENVYSEDIVACSNQQHFRNAEMRPFDGFRNMDGLSNRYTDEMYIFEPRVSCSFDAPDCGSQYIFCDRSHGRPKCVSKVKTGGRCDGFEQEDICFGGICRNGRCVPGQNRTTAEPRRTTTTSEPMTTRSTAARSTTTSSVSFNNCFNEHPCCDNWADKGECSKNPDFMNSQCEPSCGQCRPSFDKSIECSNHHDSCIFWERRGECKKNALWMEENCRKSCGMCERSKTERCKSREEKKPQAVQRAEVTRSSSSSSKPPQVPAGCTVTECYNEDKCCDEWEKQGQCSTHSEWMLCNCQVSCGVCQPTYEFGSCADYHRKCPGWMKTGECTKNPWMLENCRTSCQTCKQFPQSKLKRECYIECICNVESATASREQQRGAKTRRHQCYSGRYDSLCVSLRTNCILCIRFGTRNMFLNTKTVA